MKNYLFNVILPAIAFCILVPFLQPGGIALAIVAIVLILTVIHNLGKK